MGLGAGGGIRDTMQPGTSQGRFGGHAAPSSLALRGGDLAAERRLSRAWTVTFTTLACYRMRWHVRHRMGSLFPSCATLPAYGQ